MSINPNITDLSLSKIDGINHLSGGDSFVNATIAAAVIITIIAIPLALIHDRRRRKKMPDTKPFRWGYFNIYSSALFLVPLGAAIAFAALETREISWPIVISLNLVIIILHYFAFRRSRAAFIIITLLSINLLIWFINGFYLGRRWLEMRDEYQARRHLKSNATTKAAS